jgi:hypothetical protein
MSATLLERKCRRGARTALSGGTFISSQCAARRWFATAGARPAKTLLEVAARRKLPVWRTVRACSATVLHSLGRLVRITWLRLLLVLPVDAATHRLVSYISALPAYRRCPDG